MLVYCEAFTVTASCMMILMMMIHRIVSWHYRHTNVLTRFSCFSVADLFDVGFFLLFILLFLFKMFVFIYLKPPRVRYSAVYAEACYAP